MGNPSIESMGTFFMESVSRWEWAQKHIYPVLRPQKEVEDIDIPWCAFLDLTICYIVRYQTKSGNTVSLTITDRLLELWNAALAEVHNTAMKNLKYDGYYIRDMSTVIRQMFGEDVSGSEVDREDNMYVLVNKLERNGAAAMLDRRIFKEFAEKRNSDLYIIPSSVHELILIPATGTMCSQEISKMIQEVNDQVVDEKERLANHPYLYRRDRDTIEIPK